jgi:DNA-binding PadR family transcriptional regulator
LGFKHFVLGYFVDNAAHGYDLIKKCFMDFFPVSPDINQGRLYTTLNKLEKESLIERKTRSQEDLPDQKIIYITSQGREEFNGWLDSMIDEEDKTKFDFFKQYPFLSKVNYYKHMPPEKAWLKFKGQLEISLKRLGRFNEAREEMIQKRVDHYRIRIIEYGIEVEKVKVAWLQEMISELKEKVAPEENTVYPKP